MKVADFIVRSNEKLNNRSHLIKVAPVENEMLNDIFPGQFVQIQVDNSAEVFLRRPISINFVDINRGEIWFLVQHVGLGSGKICELKPEEPINIIYPLGNSFTIPDRSDRSDRILLIGGGIGSAPLLFLAKVLSEEGLRPDILLGGGSSADIVQRPIFEQYGDLNYTTEDGTLGEKGFVTDHSLLQRKVYDFIFCCGPKPMMVAVAGYAKKNGIECEVSLENLMACGFGACLCCVEKTVRGNVNSCTEGPVFNIKELTWID